MQLSIVIPTHHRTDLLVKCLGSIRQFAPANTEIIVVDDASPNATASDAAREFPEVRVIHLERQRGFCAAANAGIRAANGDLVELLNDDTEVTAGWANAALAVFRERPELAAIAPLVLQWPGDRIDSAGDRYYIGGIAGKRGHGEPLRPEFLRGCYVFGASGCGAFYRRDALLAVGAFPEEFGAYFDDIDLSFRLRRAGHEIWYEPASRILHHGSASYGRPSGALLEQQSRNEELVFWRNVPEDLMFTALPKHLAVLAGKAWRRWRAGELVPFLRGRCEAWRDIGIARRRANSPSHLDTRLAWDETWWVG